MTTRFQARVSVYLCLSMLAIATCEPARGNDDQSAAAPAITLRKCVAAGGSIAYQSQPCAALAREVWSREAPLDLPLVSASAYAKTQATATPVKRCAQRSGTGDLSRRNRCDAARVEAARKRDRDWNRLGFDALSRLDAWVAERCR